MTAALAFDALGDPTRRAIFELLRGGRCAVVDLASRLPVSRPAVSQHLRVLKDAGLVADRAVGRRRLYEVDQEHRGLESLGADAERIRAIFDTRTGWAGLLERFGAEAGG